MNYAVKHASKFLLLETYFQNSVKFQRISLTEFNAISIAPIN